MLGIGIVSILISVALVVIYYALFVRGQKKNDKWLHAERLFLTAMSVLLGVGIFFIQQGSADVLRKNALVDATKEELRIILESLRPNPNLNSVCETGSVLLNTRRLPGEIVAEASASTLIDPYMIRHLIYLNSFIQEHNRWADFGVDAIKDEPSPNTLQYQDAKLTAIDLAIVPQAQMILECFETGTSQIDDNCR